ncbi:GNAT family N-acetyltransferase [Roseivivax marinus]|uniref:GNAT family N-acetyltransferase n=1 Tax=Roseivivax marinus TaxID=1379903 RepID=UPI00273E1745|nr:GNAT family N-acetyltransferase [Roseivivax marinus]
MTPDDIAALMQRAYRHQTPWRPDDVAAVTARRTTRVFSDDGAVLIAQVVADEAEILALATDPDRQREGRAARLLDTFHAEMAEGGVTRTVLDVAEDNAPALALYESRGYRTTAARAAYYKRPEGGHADALLMARPMTEGHARS